MGFPFFQPGVNCNGAYPKEFGQFIDRLFLVAQKDCMAFSTERKTLPRFVSFFQRTLLFLGQLFYEFIFTAHAIKIIIHKLVLSKHLAAIFILYILVLPFSFSKSSISTWAASQSTQHRHLTFQYFRRDRKQIGNGTAVKLNTNVEYVNIFNIQRCAPDEPSSFSSLEYTFFKKQLSENIGYQFAAGVYRNHIKGDFLLDKYTVHFGRGNSQVGLSTSTSIWA